MNTGNRLIDEEVRHVQEIGVVLETWNTIDSSESEVDDSELRGNEDVGSSGIGLGSVEEQFCQNVNPLAVPVQ